MCVCREAWRDCTTFTYLITTFFCSDSKKFDKKIFHAFEDDLTAVPVPLPLDDDGPLPTRNLARLSHTSMSSDMSAQTAPLSNGSKGLMHSQLQKMQLSEVLNMLLPDGSNHNILPSRHDALSATGRSSVSDDPELSFVRGLQEAYRPNMPSSSGLDLSAGIEAMPTRHPHSPSPIGTPHSDAGISGQTDPHRTAFTEDIRLTFPIVPAGESDRRHKWLGRSVKQQPVHLRGESWSSPLQHTRTHRRSASHQRTISAGSDALAQYATEAAAADGDFRNQEIDYGDKIEVSQ
jgi:hypothetical protein